MEGWSAATPLIRHDDPYHDWALRVARAATGGEVDGLCPVVLEVRPEAPTFASLRAALLEVGAAHLGFDGEEFSEDPATLDFRLSAYDRDHFKLALQAARLGAEEETGPGGDAADFDAKTAYARILFAYATEARLFGNRTPDLWTRPRFEILFAGRAIRDTGTTEVGRDTGTATGVTREAMICVIDDSLAFLNDAFTSSVDKTGARRTVISDLWFQDKERPRGGGVTAGARLEEVDIEVLLARVAERGEAALYRERILAAKGNHAVRPIDLASPDHQPLAFPVSHGTHVASTALRSFVSHGGDLAALAFAAVTVPSFATQDTSGSSVGSYILAAIIQAMRWNDGLSIGEAETPPVPLVMNCSYGVTAGPKDGSGRLSRTIARLLDARNRAGHPTTLVVPMGNARHERTVASCRLSKGKTVELDWVVEADDRTPSFLEIHAEAAGGDADFVLELIPPPGRVAPLRIDTAGETPGTLRLWPESGAPAAAAGVWPCETGSGWTRRMFLALGPTRTLEAGVGVVPFGRWRLRITGGSAQELRLLATIQRDDAPGTYPQIGRQSYFDSAENWTDAGAFEENEGPVTDRMTASSYASIDSEHVVVAGAGRGEAGDSVMQVPVEPSDYASRGPRQAPAGTRPDPDMTALSDRSAFFGGRYGAATYSGTEFVMSGSSVAAPLVTGYLAAHPDLVGKGMSGSQETKPGMGVVLGPSASP